MLVMESAGDHGVSVSGGAAFLFGNGRAADQGGPTQLTTTAAA